MNLCRPTLSFAFLGFLVLNSPVNAQKLESGTAGATTTPQYVKKVAQTYCDFLTAGIPRDMAIRQAEKEVAASSIRPQPFNHYVYKEMLNKAVGEKGFCSGVEDVVDISNEPMDCSLSPRHLEILVAKKIHNEECGGLLSLHQSVLIQWPDRKHDAYWLKAIQDPSGKSGGRYDCCYPSPDYTSDTDHPVSNGGVFAAPLLSLSPSFILGTCL